LSKFTLVFHRKEIKRLVDRFEGQLVDKTRQRCKGGNTGTISKCDIDYWEWARKR